MHWFSREIAKTSDVGIAIVLPQTSDILRKVFSPIGVKVGILGNKDV